jgi:hypothetical protein
MRSFLVCILHQIYFGSSNQEEREGGACGPSGESRGAFWALVRNLSEEDHFKI